MSSPNAAYAALVASLIACGMPAVFAAGAEAPAASAPAAAAPAVAEKPAIADKMDVAIDYTLTVDGKVMDTSEGRGPLRYVQGRGQIIPGLEQALVGLHAGDSKEVTVAPEQGYGPVDPTAVVEIPKAQLPKDTAPTVGMALHGRTPDGQGFAATIKEIKADSVMLDLNHPLAGKTLHFKVKVADVKPSAGAS